MWIQAIYNFIASGVMRHIALKITPHLRPKEVNQAQDYLSLYSMAFSKHKLKL